MTVRMEYNNTDQVGDLVIATNGNVEQADELKTAVLISLYTDREADESDGVDPEIRRGWWGDKYADVQGDKIGSRLWLLKQKKANSIETPRLAERYALEALQWMIDDGIASQINVDVSYLRAGQLRLDVQIQRPDQVAPKWESVWEGEIAI